MPPPAMATLPADQCPGPRGPLVSDTLDSFQMMVLHLESEYGIAGQGFSYWGGVVCQCAVKRDGS